MSTATAFAPPSIGNVAVGFDLLGHSLVGPGDRVTVTRNATGRVEIAAIRPATLALPTDAIDNTAGRALQALCRRLPKEIGFAVELDKGIPLGSGMGGSAASAVAAVVAANALLDEPVDLEQLYQAAMAGEGAAAGSAHGDNVGPMLLGGLVIAPKEGAPVRVPAPEWLHVALVHPHMVLETRRARAVLGGAYALHEFVAQSEGLALVLAGLFTADPALLRRGLRDVLIEPRRAALIPGFARVKQAALDHGAFGASIAGAGPSVFGWFASAASAAAAGAAMAAAFGEVGLASDTLVSPVNGPAAEVVA